LYRHWQGGGLASACVSNDFLWFSALDRCERCTAILAVAPQVAQSFEPLCFRLIAAVGCCCWLLVVAAYLPLALPALMVHGAVRTDSLLLVRKKLLSAA